ncbi:DUF2946 family protein [Pseudomonas sp. Gutcm_11s]|uniref:DUF2946 family protein n=1 Tax=Pseudomonas sp. Gutcm_11s TaxID=3026088 RepID=UPI002360B710|nr:DUF2946 family protein [Pseudomonas sp. Gutcm_11s]MDD0844795.1 DUF2946 family protein [Pseudomonas sp. Gutcm_11s]
MPSTRHLQRSACLALLAMFLLLAAPLFSQALAAAQAPGWMSEMVCGDGGHDQPAHDVPAWAQCGYCILLLSSPALAGAAPVLQGGAGFVADAPLPMRPHIVLASVTAHDAAPRAPPQRLA